MRRGVRIALDWGDARIGVAACDPDGVLAYPVATVRAGAGEIAELVDVVAEYEPIEVCVGLPRSLSGAEGPAAAKARERAGRLADVVEIAGPAGRRTADNRDGLPAALREREDAPRNSDG